MTRPVSIAVATCNGAPYIRQQLQSLYGQTLAPAEIVVCDDRSDDGTAAILQEEAAAGRIRLFENPQRLGVIANFQRAVSCCQPGNNIALCDQDDVWAEEKLATNSLWLQAAEDRKTGPALSFSDLALTDATGHLYAGSFWKILRIRPEKERLQSLLFGNFLTGCTLLMNPEMRRCFEEMSPGAAPMHDAWLGLIAFSFGSYGYSPHPLVRYRQHGGNVTAATNRQVGLREKIADNLAQFRGNRDYLAPQIRMAKAFLALYCDRLSPLHRQQLSDFCQLESASWITKKALSLTARSYRLRDALKLPPAP